MKAEQEKKAAAERESLEDKKRLEQETNSRGAIRSCEKDGGRGSIASC